MLETGEDMSICPPKFAINLYFFLPLNDLFARFLRLIQRDSQES